MKTWGLDASVYQGDLPWKTFKDKGCNFAIFKFGQACWQDSRFEIHLNAARNAGIDQVGVWDMGAYHWIDPVVSAQKQIDYILSKVDKYHLDFWAMDLEQWWASNGQYFSALKGQIPWSSVTKVAPSKINDTFYKVCSEVAKKTDLVLYSAPWFINAYCPDIKKWSANYKGWIAEYFDYGNKTYRVTWDQYEQILNKISRPKEMLPGQSTWKMWQFSSRILLPGMNYAIDLNLMNGASIVTPAPELPDPMTFDAKVTAWALQGKEGAGSWYKTVAWYKKGDALKLEKNSKKNGYYKVYGKNVWVSSVWVA